MARKNQNLPKRGKRKFAGKLWIAFPAILTLVIILGFVFSSSFLQPTAKLPLRAVIIDQLAASFPNASFVANATLILQNYGFSVTYYDKNLDVGFFNNLANSNYGLVIIRAHSALRNDSSTVDLFTSERYDSASEKYSSELDAGLLTIGEFLYKPGEQYYALSSLFIKNLAGRFPSSIVIAMGCQSLKQGCEQMAQAFLDKGAKAYIGWTDIVMPNDTDQETMNLLSALLNENATILDAVADTDPHLYHGYASPDNTTIIDVQSTMSLYPWSNGNLTIPQLLDQPKTSSASVALNSLAIVFSCVVSNKPEPSGCSHSNVWLGKQFLIPP